MLIWQDLPARYVQESPQMIATSTNLFIMPHLPSLAFEQVILFVRYNASTEELFFPVKSLTPLLDNDEVWGVTFSDGDRVVQSRAGSNLHVLEHPPPDYFNKLETLALETLPSAAVPCEDLTRWLAPKMAASSWENSKDSEEDGEEDGEENGKEDGEEDGDDDGEEDAEVVLDTMLDTEEDGETPRFCMSCHVQSSRAWYHEGLACEQCATHLRDNVPEKVRLPPPPPPHLHVASVQTEPA
jgi:hypothetical protein